MEPSRRCRAFWRWRCWSKIGPILAGLLVAARMGAGLAAELGSMVLNEEIDARVVLGADPVPTLVAPRAIACAVAVPLLTVIIDASALLGSLAAELTAGKSTMRLFWSKSLVFLRLSDVVPGDAQDGSLRPAGGA